MGKMARRASDPPDEDLQWVISEVGRGARILELQPMALSSTAQHAIDIVDRSGRVHRWVLRRYLDAARLANDPWYQPEHEVEALRIVADADIPAPRLIAEDAAASICDVPTLLVTRIPGRHLGTRRVDLERYLRQAAEVMHLIHAIEPSLAAGLPVYAPYEPPSTLSIPFWSSRPELWTRVLEVLAGPAPDNEGRFIHRDYHAGNILFARGRITGVVDWPTACRGPRSIDVARMRLNLVGDFDAEVASRFLDLYGQQVGAGWRHEPYWDLLDAVDSAQDEARPRSRRQAEAWERFERWVEHAAAQFGR
jgi:aminoglycoside phosphotransferase (APT) family kinase protein